MHIVSSKVSDCIFEIHQLWQSGFSRVYSNCWCRCSFELEIIKTGQSFYKMYSNNILNCQEATTILNAHTKKVWKLIVCTSYVGFGIGYVLWHINKSWSAIKHNQQPTNQPNNKRKILQWAHELRFKANLFLFFGLTCFIDINSFSTAAFFLSLFPKIRGSSNTSDKHWSRPVLQPSHTPTIFHPDSFAFNSPYQLVIVAKGIFYNEGGVCASFGIVTLSRTC